jgi:DNA-binding transcriptional LysR family regulator
VTRNLDSELLRVFVTVTDAGSVSGGAKRLGRTQSAVSMQIRKLEEAAGHPLFRREPRGVRLTASGEALLLRARSILTLLGEAESALNVDPLAGHLSIGVPEEYGAPVLPEVLARFAETHPEVEVTVHCEPTPALEAALDAGTLDLAVLAIDSGQPGGEVIAYDPTVWVASSRHRVETADPVPVALYDQDCWWRDWALRTLDARGRRYRVAYTSRSVAGVQAAVRSGLAVAVLARSTMPANSRLLDAADGFAELPGSSVVLRRGAHQGPIAERMVDALRAVFRTPTG